MGAGITAIILVVAMFALLGSGIWVAVSLLAVGYIALEFFTPAPAGSLMASTVWDASWNWALTALPLFIWMGEILFRSRLSEDMFKGLAPWLSWLPGRLLHVNIVGCGVMAAVAGSSAVTCATVGRMSIPELKKRGYDENMSIGTLAGSGTLGLLIPPSIMLIVYGVIAQQSIARMFIAGILPGIMLVLMFMGFVVIWSWIYPKKTPPSDIRMSFREKIWSSRRLIPVICLIIAVIGSIYGGIATPTEAATLGVIGALVLAKVSGALTWATFMDSLLAATKTSCMIAFILVAAAFLSISMGFTGLPRVLAGWVNSLGLSVPMLLCVLTIFFVILGCFLDGVSMMVLTASVVLPMVQNAGIDLIWFGIYIVIVVEMAQITPPVGFNLFVLQGMTGRDIIQVTKASIPFFCVMVAGIVVLAVFPEIATFLPKYMVQR
ncbi:MAG: TRAP transporter large permease subunit [Alphaproteobacteria bacterium]|nr:TRAP transporter large permease subunit [Alphaproteobacteria bacterium]